MFSSTFYDKLDPKYREKLLEIEKTFQTAKPFFELPPSQVYNEPKFRVCHNGILDFCSRYMMPKELWDKILSMYCYFRMNFFESSEHQFQYQKMSSRKLYTGRCHVNAPMDIKDFCYPHIDMNTTFERFERARNSFVPKSVYQTFKRMKLQYDKIKAVEEDEEQWLEAIFEVDDEKFIEHNIEFRIRQDLTNKDLWKFFLGYFKSHDQQKLLQAYSKYCRFFLDDTEMLEEYRIAAGDQKVCVPWRNAFDFEVYDEYFYHRQRHERDRSAPIVPLQCHFNAENALNQRFPFRSNLMNYILKNANACVLHDLFKSCKWFYLKNPVTICYRLTSGSYANEIALQRISFFAWSPSPIPFKQLYIQTYINLTAKSCPVGLISRIYRCTAKYVWFHNQRFTDEELQILIGYGNVIELRFWDVQNSKNEFFKLENVLEMLPKIKKLCIDGIQCTPETSKKLCEMPFENKMRTISLVTIQNDSLEPVAFAEFINKSVLPEAFVEIEFCSETDETFLKSFFPIFKAALDKI